MAVCNEPQYAALRPAQIVPALADYGEFLTSESSFCCVLQDHQQDQRRRRARPRSNRLRCPGGVLMGPTGSGAQTSPTCPPAFWACAFTSTWWCSSGAARSSPGASSTDRTPWWVLDLISSAMGAATLEELGVLRSFSRPRAPTTPPTPRRCSPPPTTGRRPQQTICPGMQPEFALFRLMTLE